MEEHLLIGRKLTRKRIIKVGVILFTFSTLCLLAMCFTFTGTFFYWLNIDKKYGFLISFIFLLPIYSIYFYNLTKFYLSMQYLEITNGKIIFNKSKSKREIFDEIKVVWRDKSYCPDIQFELSDIISLQIKSYLGLTSGRRNANVAFQFILKDGLIISIIPKDLKSQKGQFARFVDILENEGIYIIDPHGLREVLENDIVVIKDYIIKNHKGEWMYDEI